MERIMNGGEFDRIDREEEVRLARLIKNGDVDAREKMIKANMPLVVHIASDFKGQWELEEVVSEGYIGLIKAVEKFNPDEFGTRFSTYAVYWIKREMREGISNKSKTIRIPKRTYNMMGIVAKAKEDLSNSLGHSPEKKEIAEETGLSTSVVSKMLKYENKMYPLDERMTANPHGSDYELNEYLKYMDVVLDGLPETVKKVLVMQYGLRGGSRHTLLEIGKKMRLTSSRIQQISKMGLKMMRIMMEKEKV